MIRQSLLDQVMHRFALDSRALGQFWFGRECERNGSAFDAKRENLFIAGIARAGSTALLNGLYGSGGFAATTYAMMPFVLAPSIARLAGRLPRAGNTPVERAHSDGIDVGLDSPEALDGVFWSRFFPPVGNVMEPREVPPEVLRGYAMFIENLLRDAGRERYLSKMNQGIDRLACLAAYFERSVFLLPFRDPLAQASSLRRQHQRFGRLSGYEKKYFGWLGHHEFGALHRRFYPDGAPAKPELPATDLNYWLRQWRDGYAYLSRLTGLYPNLLPVCYETMAQSKPFWEKLSQRLRADLAGEGFSNRNPDAATPAGEIDASLLRDCRAIYDELSRQGRSRLGL